MKVFVVGCGSIGKRHIRNLKQLQVEEIVVYDSNLQLAESVAKEYRTECVDSLESGISALPNVALVCVPNYLHVSVATRLASEKIDLFIEKPLDSRLDNIGQLIELVEKHRLIDMVGCNFRFDGGLSLLKKLLDKGEIGVPLSLKASFGHYLPDWRPGTDYRLNYAAKKATGGGVILDRIHEFDYVLWMMGDVTQIEGVAGKIGHLEIETEDNADVIFVHKMGSISNIHIDYLRHEYVCTCEVLGSEGILVWDYRKRSARLYKASEKLWIDYSSSVPEDTNAMYVEEMKYFLDCVKHKKPTFNSVRAASRTLEIVLRTRQKILMV